ncbi:MAG: PilZ domain-containing protein [Methylococcales bacterium]
MRYVRTGRDFEVPLIDISAAGCSIYSDKKLECGELLQLILRFSTGKSFEFDCVIANRRAGDRGILYGLMFHKPNHRPFEESIDDRGQNQAEAVRGVAMTDCCCGCDKIF